MSAHHETRARTTARSGGGGVCPSEASSVAAPHSAHRPGGSAVHPAATVLPPCLVAEDLSPRVAGARGSFWTAERDAILTRLWSQADPYMTSNAIAKSFGLTKNAIVGRARRMGLPQRSTLVLDRPTTTSIHGAEVRRLAELGHSQREIAKALKLTRHGVSWICGQLGLRMDKAAMKHAVARSNRKRAGEQRMRAEPRGNPFLTPAQQENVSSHKKRMWGNPTLRALPPPDAEEAARLVAEFIARRGVTVCPPAAEIVVPTNAGFPFR